MASANGNGPPFQRPRIVVGYLLFSTACLLAVIDALPFEYTLDNVTFLLMLGTGSVILGVEAFRKFIG